MRWNLGIAAVLAVIILSPAPSHAGVNVRFVSPSRYTDAGSYYTSSASVEAAVRAHLDRLGKRFLAPGQNLNIDIVDIDVAGYQQPLRFAPNNVRIATGVTLPRTFSCPCRKLNPVSSALLLGHSPSGHASWMRSADENIMALSYVSLGIYPDKRLAYRIF